MTNMNKPWLGTNRGPMRSWVGFFICWLFLNNTKEELSISRVKRKPHQDVVWKKICSACKVEFLQKVLVQRRLFQGAFVKQPTSFNLVDYGISLK